MESFKIGFKSLTKSIFYIFLIQLHCVALNSAVSIPVKTSAELTSALNEALPGDIIQLAPGSYVGNFTSSQNGTQALPITLEGPKTAVLKNNVGGYGFYLFNANHWIVRGFSVTQGKIGVVLDYSNFNTLDNLTVYDIDQEGIHLRFGSSDNLIKHCQIFNLGLVRPGYGEGIYIGQSWHFWVNMTLDRCDRNKIIQNYIGPDVRGESIDIKEGTCCGLIDGNIFDGNGMTGTHFDDAWIDMKGENYTIQNNHGFATLKDGFWVSNELPEEYNKTSSCNNVFRNNFCDLRGANGYCVAHNGTDVLSCNNIIYSSNWVLEGLGVTDGVITNEEI